MRSTSLIFCCIVLCLGAFVTAETSASSQDVDFDQVFACMDPCSDQLNQQFDAACGAGTAANATEEQTRCVCTSQSLEGAIKNCLQQNCNATVVTAALTIFYAPCQPGLNGAVPDGGSGGSGGHNSAFVLLAGLGLAFISAVVTLN